MRKTLIVFVTVASTSLWAQQSQPQLAEIQRTRTLLATSQSEQERVDAAFELANLDPRGAVPFLSDHLLQDQSQRVRIDIINALSEIISEASRDALADASRSGDGLCASSR